MKLKLGDKLNLNLQLWDGDRNGGDVRVFCQLRDKDGASIEPEFEVLHVADGFYTENTRTMPAEEVVNAIFFVKKADGVTLDRRYSVAKDVYVRDIEGEIIVDTLDAKISSTYKADLEATIIEGEVLSGSVEEITVLSGEITEVQILEGEINEC